ncbi:putative PHD finger domain protein [Aspergillus lucknowensis]|uniref:PHD-type domain-containing protein n=1 Tax=Aspergillus lucknowensis TaxID=176173 RepID=A0ABR4LIV1_9EURO
MAPNLRSSSHAGSNDSRPSTPAPHTASTASSFTDSTRPRKRRRTGGNSRVPTDPLQDTPVSSQSQSDQPEDTSTNGINGTQIFGRSVEWTEPELRAPVPSYNDTPWSAVSSDANPVLATMRPLGVMPSAADLRKVGLVPSKPSTPSIPAKKDPQHVVNGEKSDDKPQTPLTPAEEQLPDPVSQKPPFEEDLAAFTVLPVPSSADADVDKLRDAVRNALRLASEADNRPVIRGLLRMWEKCGHDPSALMILDGVCQETPGPPERSMFQEVMRSAWKEMQSERVAIDEPTAIPAIGRARSASSDSSLSSAKSLDAETYAPVVVSGSSVARSRKGKQSRSATQRKDISERHSLFPSGGLQRKAISGDPGLSTEAVQAKKTRLQRSFPGIVPSESGLRSSLRSKTPSNILSPGPILTNVAPPAGDRRGRSESVASSDAGDNRRLTPSPTDDERLENNDFCRNCRRSGQLLCCDGCVNSFHFSCLQPPLDPANPPEGDWYCPKCSVSRSLGTLLGGLDKTSGKDFTLPTRIRDFFAGVRTGDDGRCEEVAPLPRINPRAARGSRSGRYDDPFLLRTIDAKGNLIFCVKCGRTTNGRRPIIQCDYCPCAFHMDCVDPPLAVPPTQRPGSDRLHHNWMCPNHVWHDMYYTVRDEEGHEAIKRIRRPKNPRYVDIEVLPDEDEEENLEDQEEEGVTYRVSEKGVKLNFIERVKRENEFAAAKKKAANRYYDYAKTKFDALTSQAHAFYASQKPAIVEEDTTAAILNSRTVAEREAAANLVSFAQSHRVTWQDEDGGISLLIDQLKANAPNDLPPPDNEIASLRSLQKLIDQRIKVLSLQSGNTPPLDFESTTGQQRARSAF